MSFKAVGVNTNKEYAISKYKSELVKQLNLIYPSSRLRWNREGHYVRLACKKILPEPIRIVQTTETPVKSINPLEDQVIALEKQYGTIGKVPPRKLLDLQELADKYARETRTDNKNMKSQFHNKDFRRYLNRKLTEMHPEKMTLEDIADELNQDDYISFNGHRMMSLSSIRNLLRYHGFDWKHKKKGRPVYVRN
ncbi:MAG: hypothetical protein ABF753_03240 [Lentilactobacillus hilgardii]|uniref:hypothetical protein n=2 Tax=Lentilactobacillus hilgardii TaxID=1588 RepID=UPI0039E908DD